MVLRAPTSILLAAVVLALVACGGKSDEEQIDSTVRSFFAAVQEKNVDKFCDAIVFTAPGRCEDVITVDALRSDGALRDIEVTDIEVNGDTATAKVRATSADGAKMSEDAKFRNVDGTWKIEFEGGGEGP
jgi:ketosteroid isomerase-like protein